MQAQPDYKIPSLDNKRCLITGGSRGIGRAMATLFTQAGARVAFTYSKHDDDADEARNLIQQFGGEPLVYKGQASDIKHVSSCISNIIENWGGIDVLINNVGINQMYPLPLLDLEDWEQVLQTNLRSAYLFSRAVLRHMIKSKHGHILSLGSFASERFVESPLHYATSKSGLRGFTESLALEVGRHNILVNLLSPGLLDSGLSTIVPQHRVQEYLDHCPLGRLCRADEVARTAAFLVSDQNTCITGAKIVMDGGI